ncbi:MAG TPA: transketolase C-terminal domain-containing protein [Candidatus Limnocylindrales bacterium]
MRDAFARTTIDLLDGDPRVALVLAEISVSGYFAPALERHPQRAINIGIAEAAMVGIAAGFAMEGFHPIAHSIAAFMAERPYEQLKLDIGYQGLGGTFVGIGGSYDYAAEGATHHAPGDAQVMTAIPRMGVLVPGHADEVSTLIRATYADPDPAYLRLAATTNPEPFDVAPGRLEVVRRGSGATIVAFGPMLGPTLLACEDLDVTICYATSLRPFDAASLVSLAGDDPVVVAVEPWYEGTAAATITVAFAHVPTRFAWIGVPRAFIHAYGTREDLDRAVGLDPAGIRRRIEVAAG